jgi:hypothetical protein
MSGVRNVPPLLLKEITRALEPLGYLSAPDRSFNRLPTPDGVEHWMALNFLARPPRSVGVTFGVNEKVGATFGHDALCRFDPVRYGAVSSQMVPVRLTGTPLGSLAGWVERSGLLVDCVPPRVVADEIAVAVEQHILPFVRSVVTLADLVAFLLRNESPFEWFRGNGAIRAAAISSLGVRVGWKPQRIREAIAPYLRYVQEGLGRHAIASPEVFVDRMIDEALTAHAASRANGGASNAE